jgi:hypothetical protein
MKKNLNLPFALIIFFIMYIFQLKINIVNGSDDSWFADISKHQPYLKWIISRYDTWSGRLFPDSMLYALLNHYVWLWRILSTVFLFLLPIFIVKILKKDVDRKDLVLCIFILGYISNDVLNTGFFWITGSINYLWPIALGLIAMFPFANRIFNYNVKVTPTLYTVFLISGFIASISNEQVALCMSAFSLLTILLIFIKRKQIAINLIPIAFVILVGTCILLFAPGNKVRWVAEVSRWFPGYDQLSLLDKAHLGIIWLYQQLFVELRNLILLLSLVTFAIYYKTNDIKKFPFYTFSILLFLFISSLLISKTGDLFYNFQLINQYQFSHNLIHFWRADWGFVHAIFPYIFWTGFSSLLVYLILAKTEQKVFVFLCLAAALSTFALLFFSPTIYASGTRTLTVGSVLLSIVIVKLIFEFDLVKNKLSLLLLGCLPLLNLLQIYVSMK